MKSLGEQAVIGLKDFQLRTVEYAYRRLNAKDGSSRFLVADEVGLGKTLVARGVIGKTIDELQSSGQVNIIYICSNGAIAKQNIKRLNITGDSGFEQATRLTLIPAQVANLKANNINFISLTPNTTFDHGKSRGGVSEERAIIYNMLATLPLTRNKERRRGLLNMLQLQKGREGWKRQIRVTRENGLDKSLSLSFRKIVLADDELYRDLKSCCDYFARYKPKKAWSHDIKILQYKVIERLRNRLATVCLDALKPDLIILDEFQRFKQLLESNDEASLLANALFSFEDVKILMLSATPYKMYTVHGEEEDNHYEDFLKTLEFLYNDSKKIEKLKTVISKHRETLQHLTSSNQNSIPDLQAKMELQESLLQVMCRTERIAMTHDNNAMLKDCALHTSLTSDDLNHLAAIDQLSIHTDGPDLVEYWKSTPYLLNFLKRYEFRRKFENGILDASEQLKKALVGSKNQQISKDTIQDYAMLDAGNSRMRQLFADTLDEGMWELLWMPPSLSYVKPEGIFAGKDHLTKVLIFSKWNAVPDAIASLVSYEAERRMIGDIEVKHSNLYEKINPLLNFSFSSDRPTGMPVVAWLMPSPTLAMNIDPLMLAKKHGKGQPLPAVELKQYAVDICTSLLDEIPDKNLKSSKTLQDDIRVDERWFWAAPILLETSDLVRDWCEKRRGWRWSANKSDDQTRFSDHLDLLVQVVDGEVKLGRMPNDLPEVLAELALAGPGTCALRALQRIISAEPSDQETVLDAAAHIASGFRSLFNMPQNIAMLRSHKQLKEDGEAAYWRSTLQYCLKGDLQAVLDEYVHVLKESLGLQSSPAVDQAAAISSQIHNVLTMRAAQLNLDELVQSDGQFKFKPFNTRCRFALRFADIKEDNRGSLMRADTVRDAFNSPFRPFVLASTSIGQEGLDFHTWCHAVMHWNLPANPIDMEQREGRVNRYKGHAVRKNVAEKYGITVLQDETVDTNEKDIWMALFAQANAMKDGEASDLVPYWICEDGKARIERRTMLLPYSKEIQRLKDLTKGLASYRLAFGQPRQEDLLARFDSDEISEMYKEYLIDLLPPSK